jgi:hypothetical protein
VFACCTSERPIRLLYADACCTAIHNSAVPDVVGSVSVLPCRLDIKDIVLCGVQTPNCIRACAYDGIALDYRVTVLSDATASRSLEAQEANLEGALSLST